MSKQPIYVAFSTQKGGAGKTTLTVLLASHLHYVKGYNVAVVDCDYPQYSILQMRERERKLILESEHFKRMFYNQLQELKKGAYPIVGSHPEQAISVAGEFSGEDYDMIFFDLPGTVGNEGIIKTLASMDYIFAPLSADRVVAESTLRYAVIISDALLQRDESVNRGLHLFWNMVDGREKTELYEVYEKVIQKLNLSMLDTYLPNSVRFRKEISIASRLIFRSTLFPIDSMQMRGSNIEELAEEMLKIIRPKE